MDWNNIMLWNKILKFQYNIHDKLIEEYYDSIANKETGNKRRPKVSPWKSLSLFSSEIRLIIILSIAYLVCFSLDRLKLGRSLLEI